MTVDKKLVIYLEKLARIELEESEREKVSEDIQDIISYMDTLNTLDTEGVEPMSHSVLVSNVWRDDTVTNGDKHTEILKNAPHKTDECFVVPKVVE